ncbi:PREDICTED: hippocampus abundant transcript 1 protein-like isoform X2 [Amphimedon queenslandica]|uniref:Major facilitator superfamily (MFS) profile domain-containing protein n=1 Tax=Amphimedon queenslandica TaxID=400682 RepID=A0AAN0IXA6_AMPQE|nr:PREDICTED: hippocampus abundant transcript 1 protein-like isoform X2 [Amphimedon queenslandica]|eukprot:XP_019849081.1 PREDICTED: hippocampus abundant transcript 1 protein-like isoform X2 [Amphimedon queenslandica]
MNQEEEFSGEDFEWEEESPFTYSDRYLENDPATPKQVGLWKRSLKWRRRIFVIEIFMVFSQLLYLYSTQIVQQYIFQTLACEALSNTPNYTAPNESICLDQDYIVSATGNNDSIIEIQQKTNTLNMYIAIIGLVSSAVLSLIYGSLSDIFGRKPFLILCFSGLCLSSALQVAVIELDLNMNVYLLIASALNGLTGGGATTIGVAYASIADVTTKKWRTLRLGTTGSAFGFSKALSYLLAYYWINNNGCDFKGPAYLMLAIGFVGLTYIILIPESLPRSKEERKEGGFKKLADGFKVFFIPSRSGFSKWWRIWVCVIVICIEFLCVIGITQVLNYFLHNKPLEWSYDFIGIYGSVTSITQCLALIVVLPLLIAIPIPEAYSNPFIILFAVVIAITTNVMMATLRTTWEIFLAGTVQTLQQVAFPAGRAILAGLVKPEDFGAVQTLATSLQLLTSVGSTVLFNKVYHPEAEVNGHHYNAGIVFWITAGFWAALIPLILLLFKKRNDDAIELPESMKYEKLN